ncbi:MAG: Unknown protein [uncultured Sulfurovum sp.]|uniref:Uncharacterized protein n=1 Tax=uncultured Sulfurovum sp. TaxID=269237 RepID=A0A6S6S2D3_9BACT|nr:MAG: Unknown protein [uncultured Sulfurovum sp.]
MNTVSYLSMNDVVGEHYIIVEVLAKDAFEILYLVRDNNRAGSLFILKELFFDTFCSRENNIVIIKPQAQGVFYKQKKEIISKINKLQNTHTRSDLKTFGYIEENNTVYTIMEYSSDTDISEYLEFEAELVSLEKETSFFKKNLKYFLFFGLLLLLGYLGFMIYQKSNEPKELMAQNLKPTIKLNDYKKETQKKDKEENLTIAIPVALVQENNISDNNINEEKAKEANTTSMELAKPLLEKENNLNIEVNQSIPNITEKIIEEKVHDPFNETAIKTFLDAFINASSQASVDEIVDFYDVKIERYFKLRNITQTVIKKDKRKYNQKWLNREFRIVDFKILKKYTKNKEAYTDLKTTTQWFISNNKGLTRKGESQGFMKLKATDNGLKVVSIYGLK